MLKSIHLAQCWMSKFHSPFTKLLWLTSVPTCIEFIRNTLSKTDCAYEWLNMLCAASHACDTVILKSQNWNAGASNCIGCKTMQSDCCCYLLKTCDLLHDLNKFAADTALVAPLYQSKFAAIFCLRPSDLMGIIRCLICSWSRTAITGAMQLLQLLPCKA